MSETEKTRAEQAREVIAETEFGTPEHFLSWVGQQPKSKPYSYGKSAECPVTQYAQTYLIGAESTSGGQVLGDGTIVDSYLTFDDGSVLRVDGRLEEWSNRAESEVEHATFSTLAEYIKSRKGATT